MDTLKERSVAHPSIALGKRLGLVAHDALLVIDVQRDFLPGGSLAVQDGGAVIAPLNAYLAAFAARHLPLFLTRDWHPTEHCSFHEQGGRWPPHCIQGSVGAQWPADLSIPPTAHIVSKATEKDAEAYSGSQALCCSGCSRTWGSGGSLSADSQPSIAFMTRWCMPAPTALR